MFGLIRQINEANNAAFDGPTPEKPIKWAKDGRSAQIYNRNTGRVETLRGRHSGDVNKEIDWFRRDQYGHRDEDDGGCPVEPGPEARRVAEQHREFAERCSGEKRDYFMGIAKRWFGYAEHGN